MALKLSDYVVTEAGFGADLGAEKFINIKCRKAGIKPDMAVVVATVKALKYHGGLGLKELGKENLDALKAGLRNLQRHLNNLQQEFGLRCVVAINHFVNDTDAEIALIQSAVKDMGAEAILARHWANGGAGAEELAQRVVAMLEQDAEACEFLYADELPLWDKISSVAKRLYGAGQVVADKKVMDKISMLNEQHGDIPVCMAKTPYSFSSDANLRGVADGHTLTVRDVRLSHGAGFLVVLCGDVMTMPGLPKRPAAERIDIDDQGQITGLF
jgi:formate--tetrahydrofolate ligase